MFDDLFHLVCELEHEYREEDGNRVRALQCLDVAKILGDTIDTVERHCTPFMKELRERVRTLLNSDAGLEKSVQNSDEKSETAVTISSQFPTSIQ